MKIIYWKCFNSRPLTFVGDDAMVDKLITPNHFLIGEGVFNSATLVEEPESISVSDVYERRKEKLSLFWNVWSKSYLRHLPCIVPQFEDHGYLKVGSIVLIREDNIPRLSWVIGRVVELLLGVDSKVRTVKLQTSKGPLIRTM